MFDIGFSEIVVIGVVALVVIGPERLPRVARTMGHMFGRLQRYVNEVKSDINREIELDELRKLQQQVRTAAQDLQQSVNQTTRSFEAGVRSIESELNTGAAQPAAQAVPAESAPVAPSVDASPSPAPGAADPVRIEPVASDGEPPRQDSLPGFDRI